MQKNFDYIEQDKNYFAKTIVQMHEKLKKSKKAVSSSKHIAKHPNGITNIAVYNVESDLVTQYNNVSEDNKRGTSQITYKVNQ